MHISIFNNLFLVLIAVCASACSHYQLGSPAELPFKTIYVAPANNDSFAPQAQAILTQQISAALLREGIRLAGKDTAEATLHIRITQYDKEISATQREDTALAQSFALELQANATLINNKTGTPYFKDRAHSSQQQTYVDGGFQPSEYQSMPVLLERLANNIKNTVISVW